MAQDMTIKVFDEDYNLRINSSDDPEHLERVAEYVDRKMRETASNYVNLSPKHIAVLAALNIADECLALQERSFTEFRESPAPAADVTRLKALHSRVITALESSSPAKEA